MPPTARPARSLQAGLAAATIAAWMAAAPAQAQQFVLEPGPEVLAGEPLQIRLTGLPPGAEIRISASRQVRDFTQQLRPYAAQARFTASSTGTLDLATAPSLPGSSYGGADLRGLFWAMRPLSGPPAQALPPEGSVLLEARQGETLLAHQTLTMLRALPAVQTRPAAGLEGAVFASLPGMVRRPALILLGGSEGGSLITRDAPVWASRGYAVLALPYYSPPGWSASGPTPPELPSLPAAFADIPIERLEQARTWLVAQAEVDVARIGVMGTSKGAEFALLAAVRMPWIRAVAAIVPTDVVWEGWGPEVPSGQRSSFAFKGQPLPFVPYQGFDEEMAGFATDKPVHLRRPQDAGRAAHPERVRAARIPVEDIAAPVLVAGAHDDQIWDSGGMAEAIARARAKAGRDTVALVYRDAGHFLGGNGWNPTTQYNAGPLQGGGTPAANAHAQAEVFAQVQAFWRRTLGPVPE